MKETILESSVESYIENFEFKENNIQFRIQSSRALESYKHSQAFILNEVVNGKYIFNKTCRELLLLKYDLWFRFLSRVEGYIIHNHVEHINQKVLKRIVTFTKNTKNLYESVIVEHDDIFDKEFTEIWAESHKIYYEYIFKFLDNYDKTREIHEFFTDLTDTISEIMNNTLFELVEIKNLLDIKNKINTDDKVFLIKTDFWTKYQNLMGKDSLIEIKKIDIFRNFYDFDEIYIKNYSSYSLNKSCLNYIQKCINVDLLLSLTRPKID